MEIEFMKLRTRNNLKERKVLAPRLESSISIPKLFSATCSV